MPSEPLTDRTAVVLGANGQDGSYLSERLLENGWRVVGLGRQPIFQSNLSNLDFSYEQLDITESAALSDVLEEINPEAIFHTAAVHGSSGFDYEAVWEKAHLVNTVSLHNVLETARRSGKSPFVFYFGSSKMFGKLDGRILREDADLQNNCIYSITKNASASLVKYYRETHGVQASTIWLFNHESPRRNSDTFFVSRVIEALRKARAGESGKTALYSLDFWCDIGHAGEFMELLADSVDQLAGHDVIMATGKTVLARDMVHTVFAKYGLDAEDHFDIQDRRPVKSGSRWQADIGRLRSLIGRGPVLAADQVINEIFEHTFRKSQPRDGEVR